MSLYLNNIFNPMHGAKKKYFGTDNMICLFYVCFVAFPIVKGSLCPAL